MKILLMALTLGTLLPAASPEREYPTDVASLFRTSDNLAIVLTPERVEAAILRRGRLWFTRDEGKRKYHEGRSLPVPPEQAALLSAILTSNATYEWEAFKACMPVWNARLKFYRAGHCLSADFCFGCRIVVFSLDGQPFADANFDYEKDQIFGVVRSLFPDDKVVREVVAHRQLEAEAKLVIKRAIEAEKLKASPAPASAAPASHP